MFSGYPHKCLYGKGLTDTYILFACADGFLLCLLIYMLVCSIWATNGRHEVRAGHFPGRWPVGMPTTLS